MRDLLRSVAREKMRKAGLRRVNKKGADGKSYFALHWREWVGR